MLFLSVLCQLEEDFKSELNQPRITRLLQGAKSCTEVRDVAVRTQELRMVPRVEEFRVELGVETLRKMRLLYDRDIRLADARPAAERTRGVTKLAHWSISERVRVK